MSEFTNTITLINHLKLYDFTIKRRDFKKFGLFDRIEYIATDGNVFIYFEPMNEKYFLAVATDEEVQEINERGMTETIFYHKKSLRSSKLHICNNDHSIAEIVGAVNDYKGGHGYE